MDDRIEQRRSGKGRPMCISKDCLIEVREGDRWCEFHEWENQQMLKEAQRG